MTNQKSVLIFLLLFPLIAYGQKVDLDPYRFNFEYRNLPHTLQDTSLKTYEVTADLSSSMEQHMTADVIGSKCILQGYKKEENADINFVISFGDFLIEKYQIVENVSESKNKDGSITKNYSYYVSMNYTISGYANLNGRDGSPLIKGNNLFPYSNYNWSSSTYATRSEASTYYYNNKYSIINKLARERIEEGIKEANRWANYSMGYPLITENSYLWLIDNKKHPEYSAMNERWVALKPVLEGITANKLSDEDRSKILVMIEYFNGLKTTWNKDEKGDKKIRYACCYNNALLYMILDDPENAIKESDALVANDYDTKDGKNLREKAEELKALFAKNKIYSRHFNAMNKPYK